MLRLKILEASLVAAVVTLWASYGHADEFSARLSGFNELGSLPSATAFPTGAVLSDGTGTVSLQLNQKAGTIDYTLMYSNVGTTPPQTGTVSQAHISVSRATPAASWCFSAQTLRLTVQGRPHRPVPIIVEQCPARGPRTTSKLS